MLTLLISEFKYFKFIFVPALVATFLVALLQYYLDDIGSYFLMIVMLIALQNYFIQRNKENRELCFARLPVSYLTFSLFRILVIMAVCIAISLIFFVSIFY